MGWKTVIIGSECKTSISLDRMKITINNEYQTIPLCDIDTVIFSHNRVTISIPLLSELVNHNIGVIICDGKNDPIGIFQPFNGHSLVFKQLSKQIDWKLTRKKKLWKYIVEQKIDSEIEMLKICSKDADATKTLIGYRNSVYTDDQTNREAVAARVYFSEMFGRDFSRNDDNVTNYALNYGYKILASYISKCIASRGLVTQLGIHHIGGSNPFNLTYDFIETFRVLIDGYVKTHILDRFGPSEKMALVEILEIRVNINEKWIRLGDGIEDIINSYIAFLNEESDDVLKIDYRRGVRKNEV